MYVKVDFFTDKELYFKDGRYICNKVYDYAESINLKFIENPRLVEDLSEIQEYLPDRHPDKIKNFKLEAGKWYSFNWDWFGKDRIVIAKIKEVREKDFIISWRSYLWKDNDYNDDDAYMFKDTSNIKELSIKEIQPYLPIGHSDKISKQKFEIGKWYKWYQKNHENYHYGKVEKIEIEADIFVMAPWIIQCDDYNYSGTFDLSKAEQIQEISVEDVQEFLPKGYVDKISKPLSDKVECTEFKKGDYIVLIGKGQSIHSSDELSIDEVFIPNHCYKVRENKSYLLTELDSTGNTINGWVCIPYNPNQYHKDRNWRYATEKEAIEYERKGKPYDVTELEKSVLSMKEIQEECKKRFPIGCTYISTNKQTKILKEDSCTYIIVGKEIWAHSGGGCLYKNEKWADLVSLPKKNNIEVPEYIECIETRENYFIKGNVYKVIDSNNLSSAILVSNIDFSNLKAGTSLFCSMEISDKKYWKPSTKEAYEQQKSWLGASEESTTKFVMGTDPYKGTIVNKFIYDEVGQYPSISSDYWKNVSTFVEKEFDIYGPTPDIE